MPRVSQIIGPLIGGVSQAPSHMRSSEYATELVNALPHPALGTTKRPGTKHIAKLANSSDGHYDAASIFAFNASDKRRYFVSVSDGALRVVEADTGVERTVTASPGALAYLTGQLNAARPFDAVASGDHLYIINRSRVVQRGTATAPLRQSEALVSVKAADFGTAYSVRIDGAESSYRTPEGTGPEVRPVISTDAIAQNIASSLQARWRNIFTITRAGSTLHITRLDGGNFSISSGDGLADSGLGIVYGTVKSALDLPPSGVVEGFTVRVQGDPRTEADDYWLVWKEGVWQECARPGSLIELDASTMPHALTLGGALHDGFTVPAPPSAPSTDEAADAAVPMDYLPWQAGYPFVGGGPGFEGVFDVTPADGSAARVTVRYDLDASELYNQQAVHVRLRLYDGVSNSTILAEQTYAPSDGKLTDRAISVTRAWQPGDRVVLTAEVSGPVPDPLPDYTGPGDPTGWASLFPKATGSALGAAAGLTYTSASSSQVSFPIDAGYPATAQLTVTADGVSATITVPDAGYTGIQAAAAIAAAWPGTGTVRATHVGSGRLIVRNTATGTAPAVSVAVAVDYSHTLWLPNGALTPAALVGLRFLNLTSGAAGVVTANTARTVTTSALSGGGSTVLRTGDVIRIAAAPDDFALTPVLWETRAAGDDSSNPFPSFVGRTIGNIFVEQNRLGVTAGENFVVSGAGKFGRFFRTSIQQVLDSDPIDVRAASARGLSFLHVVEWNGMSNLINGRSIYGVAGDPLTPRTVSLPHIYELSSDETCKPIVVGRRLYVARYQNDYTQLIALEAVGQGVGVDAYDTTQDVPEYLYGTPIALAADDQGPLVLVTEDVLGTSRFLYVMRPVTVERSTVFAWSQWQLDAAAFPLAATMDGGDLVLVIRRLDGVYLESINTLAHLK